MALARLQTYVQSPPARVEPGQLAAAGEILESLRSLCLNVDFTRAVLTVRNLPPSQGLREGLAVWV